MIAQEPIAYQSHSLGIVIGVFIGLAIVVGLYAWWLDGFDGSYNPEHTWWTVVGGNALIGLAFAAFAWFGIVSWLAFWLLVALNIVAGGIIIAWQLGQNRRRRADRQAERP